MISAILYCCDSVHIILESFNSNMHQVTAKFVLYAVEHKFQSGGAMQIFTFSGVKCLLPISTDLGQWS